jgi:hypothetical protein
MMNDLDDENYDVGFLPPADSASSPDDVLADAIAERARRRQASQAMMAQQGQSPLADIAIALASGWSGGLSGRDGGQIYRQTIASRDAQIANKAKLQALEDKNDLTPIMALAKLRQQRALVPEKIDLNNQAMMQRLAMTQDFQKKMQDNKGDLTKTLAEMGYDFKGAEGDKNRDLKQQQMEQRMAELEAKLQNNLDLQGKKNDGSLQTQGVKNTGAATTQGIKNEGAAKTQTLKNQGAADVQTLKNQGQGSGTNSRAATAADRLASAAADKIHNDTIVKGLSTQKQLADRALGILDRPGLTNQEFNDIQMEMSNAIAGAKSAAIGKLERTEYTSLQQKFNELVQQVTGEPQEAVPTGILARAKSLAQETADRFGADRYTRAQSLRREYSNPLAMKNQNDAISKYVFTPSSRSSAPAGGAVVNAGGMNIDVSKMTRQQKLNFLRGQH